MSNAEIVSAWLAARVAGGPIARDTLAWNALHAALPDLIARLDAAAASPAQEAPHGPEVGAAPRPAAPPEHLEDNKPEGAPPPAPSEPNT